MILEEILKEGIGVAGSTNLLEQMKKDPLNEANYRQMLQLIVNLSGPEDPLLKEESMETARAALYEELRGDMVKSRGVADDLVKTYSKRLEALADSYSEVIDASSVNPRFLQVVLNMKDSDNKDKEKYIKMEKLLETGDLEKIREAYSKLSGNKIFQAIMKEADPEHVAKYAKIYVEYNKRRFIAQFAKDGKLDEEALKSYVLGVMGKYDVKERKKYFGLLATNFAEGQMAEMARENQRAAA